MLDINCSPPWHQFKILHSQHPLAKTHRYAGVTKCLIQSAFLRIQRRKTVMNINIDRVDKCDECELRRNKI